jgi:hypothetical protein
MPVDMDKKVEIAVRLAVAGMNVRDAWTEAGKPGGEAGLQNIRKHKRKQLAAASSQADAAAAALAAPSPALATPSPALATPSPALAMPAGQATVDMVDSRSARGGRASRTG